MLLVGARSPYDDTKRGRKALHHVLMTQRERDDIDVIDQIGQSGQSSQSGQSGQSSQSGQSGFNLKSLKTEKHLPWKPSDLWSDQAPGIGQGERVCVYVCMCVLCVYVCACM